MALQPGDNIGPYQVIEQLGIGGMATVYKGYHPRLDRHVAIKMMHQSFLEDPSFRARFEREAQIIAHLEHPNIVPVYDFSEHQGQPYLVMKQIDGQTLKSLMADHPLSQNEMLRIMDVVASALTYAHEKGVLHRDVKPSNVIIDDRGTPYLGDFGLARIAQAGSSTMSADMMLGTPQYISPEQAKGQKDLDARTDVYSLGVMLYELVVGRVPFTGDTSYAIVHDHIYSPVPQPSSINPDVTPQVEAVLLKALAKEPADRYSSAVELMRAYRAALDVAPSVEMSKKNEAQAEEIAPKVTVSPVSNQLPPIPPVPSRRRRDDNDDEDDENDFEEVVERWADKLEENAERWAEQIEEWADGKRGRPKITVSVNDDGLDDDERKDLELDLATDEESIRRRVQKRIENRRGFAGHLIAYLLVNGFMWLMFISSGESFPWPMFSTLAWGSGLAAHALSIFFTSEGRLEARDREVEREMGKLYGQHWHGDVAPEEFQKVRRQVYVRRKKQNGFITHAAIFACINTMLWMIWLFSSSPGSFNFPWPLFPLMGWGSGLVAHGYSAFTQSSKRSAAREAAVQREMERERQRMYGVAREKEKRKHDELDESVSQPPVRLNSEGELTDSFVEEWDAAQKRKGS